MTPLCGSQQTVENSSRDGNTRPSYLSPVQCHKPPSIVHQALCLSNLVP